MPDKITTQRVVCEGGLYSNENHILLSERLPGSATRLLNYEVSLAGGYRRINGYTKFDANYSEVGTGVSEGPILGLAIFVTNAGSTEYLAARKLISGTTYKWYKFQSGVGWNAITLPITMNTTDTYRTVTRIRSSQFNFGVGNTIIFVDGVNNAITYDGTTWGNIDVADTGADLAHAGGAQALAKPAVVTVYQNHIFMANQYANPSVIAHSAPNVYFNWTSASGAGQLISSAEVVQLKPQRDTNYVFGSNSIQKIDVDSTGAFLIKDVTRNIGCIAPDTVVEIGGDIMFLSPDGFRPVAGTSRIGDVEIETISKPIQLLISDIIDNTNIKDMNVVAVRNKSQVRFFYGGDDSERATSFSIIGGLRLGEAGQSNVQWEWGRLLGIRANVATSEYVNGREIIIHGDFDGKVYLQESGNNFDGDDILSVFSPPYLDQGDTEIRKNYRTINYFMRPEGSVEVGLSLSFDWGDTGTAIPVNFEGLLVGFPTIYGGSGVLYGSAESIYGGINPNLRFNINGSGYSMRPSLVVFGDYPPHSIQGISIEFTPNDRV